MWSFLVELTRHTDGPCTLLVLDDEYREQPRPYRVYPRRLLALVGAAAGVLAVLLVLLLVLTPLRELIPGYGTAALRQDARVAALRLDALHDSLAVPEQYMNQLRQLLGGRPGGPAAAPPAGGEEGDADPPTALPDEPTSENWTDHQQPALPVARMPAAVPVLPAADAGARYLSSLQLPALPPVSGFLSRGFDARTGHYAIDIAVEEGTMVRAIGDGYVIFADWTHEGGYAVAVQHADGYVSVYKHNQRLLKRVGDRVRAREAIAVSGNSGEFTSGPHLHFELWDNGLAQDPRSYLVGL